MSDEHAGIGHLDSAEIIPGYYVLLQSAKRQILEAALRAEGWNVAAAARRLRISRMQVWRLMRQCGLRRPA